MFSHMEKSLNATEIWAIDWTYEQRQVFNENRNNMVVYTINQKESINFFRINEERHIEKF